MHRNKDGSYKNFIVITAEEEPDFEPDTEHMMYGICTGAALADVDGATKTYPGFSLLFWGD